jgi:hypothetical protein
LTFTAIVVAHANTAGLMRMLWHLRGEQTRPPDEVIALVSGAPDVWGLARDFPDVLFVEHPDYDDWGHAKRADGLERARGEWVGFFNADDAYRPHYIETMLAAAGTFPDDFDAVYCSWNEQPDCGFALGNSTAGNFICRTALGQSVGWTERTYVADGVFIEGLKAAGARVARVDELLYFHNREEAA